MNHCVSKYLEFLMIDKVQKHSNSECYIPSSEPFRFPPNQSFMVLCQKCLREELCSLLRIKEVKYINEDKS
jgi:hypothetical protein